MPAQVAIVHGWSDTSKSFHDLRDFLTQNGHPAERIFLGDYISMDDDVRIEDVAKQMDVVVRERIEAGKLEEPFDLIVHSTGGLVAREWVARLHEAGRKPPVRRIVMLAPANFGSALASLGKSMIGRLAKGWNNWLQTGTQMLRGLELASPYQWSLACRDLLDPRTGGDGDSAFGEEVGKVWPFVIIGTRGYPSGLRQIVNENGSDGTVRVAAANLNAVGMTIDFTGNPEKPPPPHVWRRRTGELRIPFAVLPDRDHSSIIRPAADPGSQPAFSAHLGQLILQALECDTPAKYRQMHDDWALATEATAALAQDENALRSAFRDDMPAAAALHQYFQVVTRVRDDHGHAVDDYFLEFFAPEHQGDRTAVYFHSQVLEDVHVNRQAPSLRALYVDRTDLLRGYYRLISRPEEREVAVSISAAALGPNVRYFDATRVGARGSMVVHAENEAERGALQARLLRNTTHLVEIVIPRQPVTKVFRLSP